MCDPVIMKAVKLRDGLLDVSKEIGFRRDGNAELKAIDAKTCDESAKMLQVLGTEVTRLRRAIGHYLHGQLDRHSLRKITENWNDFATETLDLGPTRVGANGGGARRYP